METPGCTTIKELADFLKIPESKTAKAVFQVATIDGEERFVFALLRGDHELNETKLANAGETVADVIDGLYVSRDMLQRTREGFTGRPDLASADKGRRLFDTIVDQLVITAQKLLSQPLGTEYQDFVE